MSPYRRPGKVTNSPPVKESCVECHVGEGVRRGCHVLVSGSYGAGNEVYAYTCLVCGSTWK